MPWWGWIIIGVLLLGAELFFIEAEFFLVFIGVSAIATGLLVTLAPLLPAWAHWLVFAGLTVGSMVLFRRRVYQALRPQQVPGLKPDFIDDELQLPATIAAGESCRMELRGSTWEVRNAGTAPLAAGSRVRVVAVDGIVLRVVAA
jgi:membrane protein implicated in regulation of membrane protease activity